MMIKLETMPTILLLNHALAFSLVGSLYSFGGLLLQTSLKFIRNTLKNYWVQAYQSVHFNTGLMTMYYNENKC